MPKTANSIYESGSNLSLYNLSWLTTLEYFVNCFVYCLQGWRKLGGRGRGTGRGWTGGAAGQWRLAALLLAHPDFQSWRHTWTTDSVPFQRGPFFLNSKVSPFFSFRKAWQIYQLKLQIRCLLLLLKTFFCHVHLRIRVCLSLEGLTSGDSFDSYSSHL